jgi:hypothetical protein
MGARGDGEKIQFSLLIIIYDYRHAHETHVWTYIIQFSPFLVFDSHFMLFSTRIYLSELDLSRLSLTSI